jgi:hypothetical protein
METKLKPYETGDNYWTTEKVEALIEYANEEGLEYKEIDNPFYENDPALKKGNILFKFTQYELNELEKCANDVIYFANRYCKLMTDDGVRNVTLRDYQEQILSSYQKNRFSIFLAARQSGKCNSPVSSATWTGEKIPFFKLVFKHRRVGIISYMKLFLYRVYHLVESF